MSISENIRVTIKVCKMYYEDNMSQKEISSKLSISRPQISRILASARAQNIVSVKISNPYSDETKYEDILTGRYGLQDALIINTDGIQEAEKLNVFGKAVAENLETYISDGDTVGVMSGKTIHAISDHIRSFSRKDLNFIPLVGGIGSTLVMYHANALVKKLSEYTEGSCSILNAPFIVQSRHSCELLKNEPEIAGVLKKGMECDVALVGIGQINVRSTTAQAGALSEADIRTLKEAGAIASVCASYFDSKGKPVRTEVQRRSIGVAFGDMHKARKIAMAIGKNKIEAIKAALNSGLVDVFMTDLETARLIMGEEIQQ